MYTRYRSGYKTIPTYLQILLIINIQNYIVIILYTINTYSIGAHFMSYVINPYFINRSCCFYLKDNSNNVLT